MKLKFYLFATCAIIISGCVQDDEFTIPDSSNETGKELVLQERSDALPSVIGRTHKRHISRAEQNNPLIGNSDAILGKSYRVGNSILADFENVGKQILNLNAIKVSKPDMISNSQVLTKTESETYSYSSIESYAKKSTLSDVINSGFNVDLKIFKIGRKKKITETFNYSEADSSRTVFGELNFVYKQNEYVLNSTEATRRIYACNYLHPDFLYDIYNSSIKDFLDNYGNFVVTGYTTGGRVNLQYYSLFEKNESYSMRERILSDVMNASFKYKEYKGDGELNIGNTSYDSVANYKLIKNNYMSMTTYGGTQAGITSFPSQKLETVKVNLTPWIASLKDTSLHTLVQFLHGGLCPVSAFILEDNFKKLLDLTANGYIEPFNKIQDPEMHVIRSYVRNSASGQPLYEVVAALKTAHGDYIIFSQGEASTSDSELLKNDDVNVLVAKGKILKEKYSPYFKGLKYAAQTVKINPNMSNPQCSYIEAFDFSALKKWLNPDTGIMYLYDSAHKVALSIYTDEDWLQDENLYVYGLGDFIYDEVPDGTIRINTMARSYKIYGL